MEVKRIVVLANSFKRNARCIAGVDVGMGVRPAAGGWVRPVSTEPSGELESRHMRLEDGGPPRVLDVVDVPLERHAQDVVHPEDWFLQPGRRWRRVGVMGVGQVASLEERPDDLWLERGVGPDRVSGAFLRSRAGLQSLYLIRPEGFRVELSTKQYPSEAIPTSRRRACFSYRGQRYEMNVTDPVFIERYCSAVPGLGAPAAVARPELGDRCMLCVSLTPLYRDFHWKVAATILELP